MIHHRDTENTENESEAPNFKLQIPISKDAFPNKSSFFSALDFSGLKIIWILEFGAQNFSYFLCLCGEKI